jgi:hypothetical protein
MTNPAVYKLYKDADDGRTNRRISVSEAPDGTFALIVTEIYSNNSTGLEGDVPARGVGEAEVFESLEAANERAKVLYEENIHDGFLDVAE